MKWLSAVLLCALLSGCYSIRFKHGKRAPEAGLPRERWHHTFANGTLELGGSVKVDDLCPSGIYSIENYQSLMNVLVEQSMRVIFTPIALAVQEGQVPAAVGLFYGGRYSTAWTPYTLKVICASGPLKTIKVAIFKVAAKAGMAQGAADLFTDALVADLRKRPGVSVITEADMVALLGLERQKQIIGCSEGSCLAEIGGALGADRLITGSVGRLGSTVVINLTTLDPKTAQAVASVSERIKAPNDDVLFDVLPTFVTQLLLESPSAPKPPAK
jgi:hypothetical protein